MNYWCNKYCLLQQQHLHSYSFYKHAQSMEATAIQPHKIHTFVILTPNVGHVIERMTSTSLQKCNRRNAEDWIQFWIIPMGNSSMSIERSHTFKDVNNTSGTCEHAHMPYLIWSVSETCSCPKMIEGICKTTNEMFVFVDIAKKKLTYWDPEYNQCTFPTMNPKPNNTLEVHFGTTLTDSIWLQQELLWARYNWWKAPSPLINWQAGLKRKWFEWHSTILPWTTFPSKCCPVLKIKKR